MMNYQDFSKFIQFSSMNLIERRSYFIQFNKPEQVSY